jgi:hypothetical protein
VTRYQITFADGVVIAVDAEFDTDAMMFAEEEYQALTGKRAVRITEIRKL